MDRSNSNVQTMIVFGKFAHLSQNIALGEHVFLNIPSTSGKTENFL